MKNEYYQSYTKIKRTLIFLKVKIQREKKKTREKDPVHLNKLR
jgi:hypothetical protein